LAQPFGGEFPEPGLVDNERDHQCGRYGYEDTRDELHPHCGKLFQDFLDHFACFCGC
jgi:hypothetical protein